MYWPDLILPIVPVYIGWWNCGGAGQQPFLTANNNVKVVAGPVEEFIDLTLARDHLRADPTAGDDSLILSQVSSARQYCEGYLGRALAQQTLELGLNAFPGSFIELPNGPVRGVVSIKYIAKGQTDPTVLSTVDPATYYLDDFSDPARVYLISGQSWPEVNTSFQNCVRVQYQSGYDPTGSSPVVLPLPPLILQAMLLMLGHFYENREDELATDGRASVVALTTGAKALLDICPVGWRQRTGVA